MMENEKGALGASTGALRELCAIAVAVAIDFYAYREALPSRWSFAAVLVCFAATVSALVMASALERSTATTRHRFLLFAGVVLVQIPLAIVWQSCDPALRTVSGLLETAAMMAAAWIAFVPFAAPCVALLSMLGVHFCERSSPAWQRVALVLALLSGCVTVLTLSAAGIRPVAGRCVW